MGLIGQWHWRADGSGRRPPVPIGRIGVRAIRPRPRPAAPRWPDPAAAIG